MPPIMSVRTWAHKHKVKLLKTSICLELIDTVKSNRVSFLQIIEKSAARLLPPCYWCLLSCPSTLALIYKQKTQLIKMRIWLKLKTIANCQVLYIVDVQNCSADIIWGVFGISQSRLFWMSSDFCFADFKLSAQCPKRWRYLRFNQSIWLQFLYHDP